MMKAVLEWLLAAVGITCLVGILLGLLTLIGLAIIMVVAAVREQLAEGKS